MAVMRPGQNDEMGNILVCKWDISNVFFFHGGDPKGGGYSGGVYSKVIQNKFYGFSQDTIYFERPNVEVRICSILTKSGL